MELFNRIRVESLSGNRKREIFKLGGPPAECGQKIMHIEGLTLQKIRMTINVGEMLPDKRILITSQEEYLANVRDNPVSSCLFKGICNGSDIDLVVDFDTNILSIVSEDANSIDIIKKELEG